MPIPINIFILAMKKDDIDELDIDLNEFNDETKTFIQNLKDNRYFDHPLDCKPFHKGESIKTLINNVIEDIKLHESDYDIEPYLMNINDVGSSIEEKYDFLMKESIRIIDDLSLITKRTKSISDLLERDFKKSCLELRCAEIPHELREKLNEIRKTCFPFLTIHKKNNKHTTEKIRLDIHTADSFEEIFYSILKRLYWEMLGGGQASEEQLGQLGNRRRISLEHTSIS